jgi:hypothetical protein
MPLPQQVINQLSQERADTPGALSGVLIFTGIIFLIAVAAYFGLMFVYQPILGNQLTAIQEKISTVDQSISSNDQAGLVAFYSQMVNVQSLLTNHVLFSQFLTWLQQNTEANVYYTQLSFSSGNQITLTAYAATQADAVQQIAIFESSPEVQSVIIPNVAVSGSNGFYTFSATLVMNPALFVAAPAQTPATTAAPAMNTSAPTSTTP